MGGVFHLVDGDHILGRDFAVAVPALAGLDAAAEIAPSPVPGVERIFRPEEIARVAREHSLPGPDRPAEICFERKTQLLTAALLKPVIERALGTTGARVEILDFSRNPVPQGTLEFSPGALTAAGAWRGRILYGEGRSIPVWVRVRATDAESGAPLPLGPAAAPREVNRGEAVRVEVWSGHALVAFDSKAESSGRKGEMVLVQNPDNTRRLLARVQEKGKVVVQK
jgi:hypothetical protein